MSTSILTAIACAVLNGGFMAPDLSNVVDVGAHYVPTRGVVFDGEGLVHDLRPAGRFEVAAELRLPFLWDRPVTANTWFSETRVLDFAVVGGDDHRVDFHLAETFWRYHLPSRQAAPLFPFDGAFEVSILDLEQRRGEAMGTLMRTVSTAPLIDVWRAERPGLSLAFGPEASHAIRQFDGATHSALAPFTTGVLHVRWESDDGWWALGLNGTAGSTFDPDQHGWTPRARGNLELNRLVLPGQYNAIRAYLRASGAWNDGGPRAETEWEVGLGLRLQLLSRAN